jgi:hypothetical protein
MGTEKDVVGNITALVALFEHAAPLYQYFMNLHDLLSYFPFTVP